MSDRELDLVLYGVTGFVGKLLAEYVAATAPPDLRVGLAGRDAAKVEAVRATLPGNAAMWTVLRADASDTESLRQLAHRTRVVVTTVGPYAAYGLPLVEACAAAGTDYADLTGEALFVRASIDAAHDRARESGARIVHSCGFDSIPSDLSVHLTHLQAVADRAGDLADVTLVATLKGGLSGGTIASGRGQMRAIAKDPSLRTVVEDPYTFTTDRSLEPDLGKQGDAVLARASRIDPALTGWVATFLMAPHNTRIVRRSNALLGWAYGKDLRYREVMSTGSSASALPQALGLAAAMWLQNAAGPWANNGSRRSAVLDRLLPAPGTGPSEQARDNGHYAMDTYSTTTNGTRYHATFAQDGDPGYKATAVMLGEVALCLALDRDQLSPLTGVLTPATVMAEPLTRRLRTAGATISVRRN